MLATTALPAGAITGDYVEDFEHPFVGAVAFYDEQGEYIHRCSGSLLTPTVLLTAGHCTTDYWGPDITTARVYFQQDAVARPSESGFQDNCAPGTLGVSCATSDEIHDYATSGAPWRNFPDIRDVGLVLLDQPISLAEYGVLAAPGSLDDLTTERGQLETTFTHSGYGLSENKPVREISLGERLMARSRLTNLRSAPTDGFNLQVSFNGKGYGGACYGDSGGPVFYGGYTSNIIAAVAGWNNNRNCAGVGYFYRTVRQEVIDWILQTVPESGANNIAVAEL